MSLQLYSASAGSGKTYTLTVEYIKLALREVERRGYFRRILAVTFTTKAAEEMRSRIIEFLHGIAHMNQLPEKEQAMFRAMIDSILADYASEQLFISEDELIRRARDTQQQLLQDYGLFSVMTIDSFVQRLSSTFIEELHLPSQFEVLLDSNQLMNELLDQLLDKVNQQGDPIITNLLLDFAKSEVNEGRSWNLLRQNLHDFLKICLNEEYYTIKKEMDPLRIEDFLQIENQLIEEMNEVNLNLINLASQFLNILKDAGISGDMLAYGKNSVASYFNRIVEAGEFEEHGLSYLRSSVVSGLWTSKSQEESIKLTVAGIAHQLVEIGSEFIEIYDTHSTRYFLFKLIKKDIKKIALLATITDELHQYQNDHGAVSISEFSKRLNEIIANDPVPFIYEKLGDRFNHILIDEFQDTSILQWQNFMPLLENAVSQGKKNLLVGDAKQSIYKFRGGEVGLISSLKVADHPFMEEKFQDKPLDLERFDYLRTNRQLKNLDSNYRSALEIVNFNNDFFTWVASNPKFQAWSSLVDSTYGMHLNQIPQVSPDKYSGKVDVLVYHKPLVDNHAELESAWMLDRTLELIQQELANGFQYRDIAILTRKNKQSKYLAIQLKERNIPVISSDSLLVHYANVVGFIIAFMRLKTDSSNAFRYKELLFQYADLCHEPVDWELISADLKNNQDYYQEALFYFKQLGFLFHQDEGHLVSWVYGLVSTFNLTHFTDEIEYLFKLLDLINEFVLLKTDDFEAFLVFYDSNKATFSIASPEGGNAITITSIHRSKGLEYPVVICPFVSWTHQPQSEKVWFDLKPLDISALKLDENVALNHYYGRVTPKELTNFESLHRQKKSEYDAVFLDSLNMLYVAFTRPKQHLHILLAEPNAQAHTMTKKSFQDSLGQIVYDYCLNNPDFDRAVPTYVIDKENCEYFILQDASQFIKQSVDNQLVDEKLLNLNTQIKSQVDFRIQTYQQDLYTSAQSKREHGEMVHNLLAKIKDIEFYQTYYSQITHALADETKDLLNGIMENKQIQSYFQKGELLFVERDILCPDGEVVRPDRVIQQKDLTIIIDFKTGKVDEKHRTQLEKYKEKLAQLGYKKIKAVLIYIENQQIEEV